MAVVCEYCRKVFGLTSDDEIIFKTVSDEMVHSTVSGPTCEPTPTIAESSNSILPSASLSAGVQSRDIGLSTESPETKGEADNEGEECEVKSKRPKLSDSPTYSLDATPTDSTHRHLCVSCLGTLDETFVCEIASTIPIVIQQQGYTGVKSFRIAIHTPLSLMVRRMGMEKYTQKQNGYCKSDCITIEGYVKEELRNRLKDKVEKLLCLPYDMESPFQIVVKLEHSHSMKECQILAGMYPDCFKKTTKRGHFKNRNSLTEDITIVPVRRALESSTVEDLQPHGYLLSSVDLPCSYEIELIHKPVYIAGRYNKYSRSLSQTPWMVDGIKKTDSSVQELICGELCQLTGCSDHTFLASGREDVDVRMLGSGRPFAVELSNPKNVSLSQEDIHKAQELINKSTDLIAVQFLTEVSKEETALLKEGEAEKKKQYCALVWSERDIKAGELECLEGIKDLIISQKTPIRVLHRRSLATRERRVHSMHCEVVDRHRFKLYLCSQAGTYIKEFVHSDFGRTQPSLGGLLSGREVDILSLDVTDVQLEWPPK